MSSQRSWLLSRVVAAIATVGAVALMTASAEGACYTPQQVLPAQTVTDFLNSPALILQRYPNGGGQLITEIRDLAASDPATLPVILRLVASANKDQKTAIGSGLGQAARVCVRSDQAYATQIQEAIAQTKDQDVVLAYAGVTGDQPTAAVGAAGSSGAIGGQTNPLSGPTGGGGLEPIGGPGTPTLAFSYTPAVGGGGGGATGAATPTAAPVSP